MPAKLKKVKGGYSVATPGGIKSKRTSKAKAEAQIRLLNAIDRGWKPTGKKRQKKNKK